MFRYYRLCAVIIICFFVAGCLPQANPVRGIIKIGLVAPFSMSARGDGYSIIYAVKLALNEWNARGGAHGYRFELVVLDDNDLPAVAAQRAQELATDSLIMGVIGHYGSPTTLAALPHYRQKNLALVIPFAAADELVTPDWQGSVRIGANNSLFMTLLAARNSTEWKAKKILIMYQDLPSYKAMHDQARSVLGSAVAAVDAVPQLPDRTVLDAAAIRAAGTDPDLVLFFGNRIAGAEISNSLKKRLPRVPLILLPAAEMDAPETVKLGGDALDSVQYGAIWADPSAVSDERLKRFSAEFAKLAGGAPRTSAVLAYDGANVLFTAINTAIARDGRPSRAGTVRELRKVQHTGLSGTLSFNERGEPQQATAYLYRYIVARYPGEPVAQRNR